MCTPTAGCGREEKRCTTCPVDGGLGIPARVLIVIGGFLALPGTASAHSGAPTVALDFRLRISQATRALHAFRPTIVDGDRGLRLEVNPRATLVVLGDIAGTDDPLRLQGRVGQSPLAHRRRREAHPRFPRATACPGRSRPATTGCAGTIIASLRRSTFVPARSPGGRFRSSWGDDEARSPGTVVRVSRPSTWPWAVGAVVLAAATAVAAWRLPEARTGCSLSWAPGGVRLPRSQYVVRHGRQSAAPASGSRWAWSRPCSWSPPSPFGGAGTRCASGPRPGSASRRNLQCRLARRVRARLRGSPRCRQLPPDWQCCLCGGGHGDRPAVGLRRDRADPRTGTAAVRAPARNKHKRRRGGDPSSDPVPIRTCWRLPMNAFRPLILSAAAVSVAALSAGCGSGSSSPQAPTIQAARTFELADFEPAGPVQPGKPATVSFTIEQPNGQPLTTYRRGAGPHTGVHVIFVRDDLATIIHRHPPVAADGKIQRADHVPGARHVPRRRRRYPSSTGQPNFQLFSTIARRRHGRPQPLPPFRRTAVRRRLPLHDAGPARSSRRSRPGSSTSTSPIRRDDRRASRRGSARSRTRSSSARARSTTSTRTSARPAPAAARASSAARRSRALDDPGKLRVGVLVPVAGTWRLFLQTRANGRVLTAPFTFGGQMKRPVAVSALAACLVGSSSRVTAAARRTRLRVSPARIARRRSQRRCSRSPCRPRRRTRPRRRSSSRRPRASRSTRSSRRRAGSATCSRPARARTP